MWSRLSIVVLLLSLSVVNQTYAMCSDKGIWLQVLGSGGPENDDKRASSGYLLWNEGKARVLIDLGSGSVFRFEQTGASINDLDAILLSHLHVDHANDLPALIKAAYFSGRERDLPIYGPSGNHLMPATTDYIERLFGRQGVYPYLSSYLDGSDDFRLNSPKYRYQRSHGTRDSPS